MEKASEFVMVYVTCPNETLAKTIATQLVTDRLAACANILPQMNSIYRWNDKIQTDAEVVLLLKTKSSLFPTIEEKIRALHDYDCPCIVALPLAAGSAPYLAWLASETI